MLTEACGWRGGHPVRRGLLAAPPPPTQDYPYWFEDGIEHYCLWATQPLSRRQLDEVGVGGWECFVWLVSKVLTRGGEGRACNGCATGPACCSCAAAAVDGMHAEGVARRPSDGKISLPTQAPDPGKTAFLPSPHARVTGNCKAQGSGTGNGVVHEPDRADVRPTGEAADGVGPGTPWSWPADAGLLAPGPAVP